MVSRVIFRFREGLETARSDEKSSRRQTHFIPNDTLRQTLGTQTKYFLPSFSRTKEKLEPKKMPSIP